MLVKKLLRLNRPDKQYVEVILLSRNSADTGLRVFNSIKHYGLDITRAAFTKGEPTSRYVPAFGAHLFLSADQGDVRRALDDGHAAATIFPSAVGTNETDELRIAFDGDAVLFSDEAERVYQADGLAAFSQERIARRARAAGRRAVQGIPRRTAPDPGGFPGGQEPDPHRARHRAQRAGARARDPDAARLEHPDRRGAVPGRPRQGRVPARVSRRHLLRRPAHARGERARSTSPPATCRTASPTKKSCRPGERAGQSVHAGRLAPHGRGALRRRARARRQRRARGGRPVSRGARTPDARASGQPDRARAPRRVGRSAVVSLRRGIPRARRDRHVGAARIASRSRSRRTACCAARASGTRALRSPVASRRSRCTGSRATAAACGCRSPTRPAAAKPTAAAAISTTRSKARTSASPARAIVLDFNFAYNPSCAYDDRWSCPLSPPENRLPYAVTAGERMPS